jgi:DNA-binding PadR family transcriptional regulator
MNDSTDFLPLTAPVFHILLALAEGEMHGYAILQEIEGRSDGTVKLGTGTLYTAIKRMLASGLLERAESRVDPGMDDERRRYYRLTPLGARVAAAEAARMNALVGLAREKRFL